MSLTLLKWLRFIAPGVIFVLLASALGWITKLWNVFLPQNLKDAMYTTLFLAPAAIYYLTPFRRMSNQVYFDDVSENIRYQLVKIAGLDDDKSIYTWKSVRGIFFSLIDKNKSLEKKASLAYFNGFFWTSIADLRVYAIVFTFVALLLVLLNAPNAGIATIIFLSIGLLSIPASRVVTNRHKAIGDEQIEIIQHSHLTELKQKLEGIRDRARS